MWLALLVACPRSIAPALELEPEISPIAAAPEPAEPEALVGWILAGDPLARRPRLPAGTPPEPLGAWLAVAREDAPGAERWWALEQRFAGTIVVPLSRGGRLAALETRLGEVEAALDLAVPIPRAPVALPADARPPLGWLGTTSTDALMAVTERAVLLGWLDGPEIDLRAAGGLLAADHWARLARTPAGRLVRARSDGLGDPAAGERGAADLARATSMMLEYVAADLASDRATVSADRARVAAELGAPDGDPVSLLLDRALPALTADARSDTSTGLALVALNASRWRGTCGADLPCGGLDRAAALSAATRWGPGPAALVRLWRVAMLKDARDHLDAAWDRAQFPAAVADVVEVLLGLDPFAPLDRGVLRRASPDPAVNLALARAADRRDVTDAKGLFEALDARLRAEIAAARPTAGPRDAAALDRMARRLAR